MADDDEINTIPFIATPGEILGRVAVLEGNDRRREAELADERDLREAQAIAYRADLKDLSTEIAFLREERSSQAEAIAAPEGCSAPPVDPTAGEVCSPQKPASSPDTALPEVVLQLKADLEEFNDLRALEIAQNRRRISTLEEPKVPPPTTKTLGHLDHLAREMKESRTRQLTFTRAAKILGLSSVRVHQLRPLIEHDKRFDIVADPHHKQRLKIRMR